jgi:hypothetical protein
MHNIILILCCVGLIGGCNSSIKSDVQKDATNSPEFSLEELQHRTFNYFWDLADTANYQILDRYPKRTFSSIAATGFGLTSYLVGVEKGYISRIQASERVRNTLFTLWHLPQGDATEDISGYRGFFYHFLTLDKALRYKKVELSTIDSGLLMAGILSAQSYFDRDNEIEEEIRELSDALYRRVEWDWALNDSLRLSMGWHPERGFIQNDWHGYNEAMILLILAIGSPTHAIPADCWERWCSTYQWGTFQGQEHVNFDPLFGHQYSQMYIDFRGIQDPYMKVKGIDYFENSRRATYANRAYCIENPLNFNGYSEHVWGLTACDGPANEVREVHGQEIRFHTYRARGASLRQIIDDGTIAPTASVGSLPFAPEICIPAMEYMWKEYGEKLVGDYGFKDAFNLTYRWETGNEEGWYDTDYIGIDQGPILIQIENYQNGFVWELMKKNPYIVEGLSRAGFKGGWLDKLNDQL